MANLNLILPEMVLGLIALGLMAADIFVPAKRARVFYHWGWLAAVFTLGLVGYTLCDASNLQGLGTLWSVDPLSQFFKILILVTTVLSLVLGLGYKGLPTSRAGTFVSLLLFAVLGMMFLVSAVDLLLLFVALELISISSFILVGFERANLKSNEGAVKYFIFGAFSSAVMVYGISLFYGAAGTTSLLAIAPQGPLMILGLLFILLGFGFKASIAPMHFWVPDAYEGAPTPVTAFLSVAPKIAALAAILRIYSLLIPASKTDLTALLTLLAVLTMTIGNFTALFQTNVKRMLAYSSVAQAGYMMIGIITGDALGLEGVLLYSAVYVSMNIGAFAVAIALANENAGGLKDPYDITAFNGLAKRSLGLALCMAFCLLSLAGIPPLAGFVGKFYIFSAAMKSGYYGLAVIGVINSVVSVYYYMRIAFHMFLKPGENESPVRVSGYLYGAVAVAVAAVLFFGIYPEPLVAGVQASAHYLP